MCGSQAEGPGTSADMMSRRREPCRCPLHSQPGHPLLERTDPSRTPAPQQHGPGGPPGCPGLRVGTEAVPAIIRDTQESLFLTRHFQKQKISLHQNEATGPCETERLSAATGVAVGSSRGSKVSLFNAAREGVTHTPPGSLVSTRDAEMTRGWAQRRQLLRGQPSRR